MVEERGDLFGVAMWVYDGAEVCKFTGTFILEKISEICIKEMLDYIGMTVYQVLQTKVVLN